MVQALNRPARSAQHFIHSGVTWEGFKAMQAALDSSGLRMSYFQGEIELLTVSDLHGLIAENLASLLVFYMASQGIRFVATGDSSIEVEGHAAVQADKTYCFSEARKPVPDLAIEVVISGERETKLKRYAVLSVPEVWFWIDGKISVYCLDAGKYAKAPSSAYLPELDIQRLASCASIEVFADAVAAFNENE